MPRYFFHSRNGGVYADPDGVELADDDVARTEAVVTAGAILKDLGSKFWAGEDWSMLVQNEAGETICELLFTARPNGAGEWISLKSM